MRKDPELPDRFAKIVLTELADIHALLLGIADYAVADVAGRADTPTSQEAQQRITRVFSKQYEKRADAIYAGLLKKLRLNV